MIFVCTSVTFSFTCLLPFVLTAWKNMHIHVANSFITQAMKLFVNFARHLMTKYQYWLSKAIWINLVVSQAKKSILFYWISLCFVSNNVSSYYLRITYLLRFIKYILQYESSGAISMMKHCIADVWIVPFLYFLPSLWLNDW